MNYSMIFTVALMPDYLSQFPLQQILPLELKGFLDAAGFS